MTSKLLALIAGSTIALSSSMARAEMPPPNDPSTTLAPSPWWRSSDAVPTKPVDISHFAFEMEIGGNYRFSRDDSRSYSFAGVGLSTGFGYRGDGIAFYGTIELTDGTSLKQPMTDFDRQRNGPFIEARPGVRLELFTDRLCAGVDLQTSFTSLGGRESDQLNLGVGAGGFFGVDLFHGPDRRNTVLLGARVEATHYADYEANSFGTDLFLGFRH
jgi:hypothetical protein